MPRFVTILLASVLKPLDDTRMLDKFARTLAQRPNTQVHVAGRLAPAPAGLPSNVYTHALLEGTRLSWARLQAQWHYWRLLQRVQPTLVIVHAPELLPLTVLWQALGQGGRFVYDVRENYALNIQTQQVYPAWARGLLAGLVRWLEALAARRATAVLLAERSYAEELPFLQPEHTLIIENKYQPYTASHQQKALGPLPATSEPLRLLYSGTISALNGVFEALIFWHQVRAVWPLAHLTIMGFCQQPALLERLRAAVAEAGAGVTLVGGNTLVPHAHIVAEIGRSHLGLLPYRPHPSTAQCIPTKLFEYLAHGLPMVLPPNPLWRGIVEPYQAGVWVDFQALGHSPLSKATLLALLRQPFYPAGVPEEAFWSSEAEKLHHLMNSIK
ncbi:glycosyltransferase [Hymenobacter taeanensis]|uniref:Glycosyltransferase n=1 Tax=Hymenobacter taeanensis TaxID=2735321 RepID=A0A6M6BM84_9BACT|nr:MULTISPECIES: glycosyltransferase [Hymenobacter]QJX48553.1 glycosyltransferase [Hymenobacter taeanensis]UOQ81950.1 glycosyltransferase [Hymenobacter sp. 5414T-23]